MTHNFSPDGPLTIFINMYHHNPVAFLVIMFVALIFTVGAAMLFDALTRTVPTRDAEYYERERQKAEAQLAYEQKARELEETRRFFKSLDKRK